MSYADRELSPAEEALLFQLETRYKDETEVETEEQALKLQRCGLLLLMARKKVSATKLKMRLMKTESEARMEREERLTKMQEKEMQLRIQFLTQKCELLGNRFT